MHCYTSTLHAPSALTSESHLQCQGQMLRLYIALCERVGGREATRQGRRQTVLPCNGRCTMLYSFLCRLPLPTRNKHNNKFCFESGAHNTVYSQGKFSPGINYRQFCQSSRVVRIKQAKVVYWTCVNKVPIIAAAKVSDCACHGFAGCAI